MANTPRILPLVLMFELVTDDTIEPPLPACEFIMMRQDHGELPVESARGEWPAAPLRHWQIKSPRCAFGSQSGYRFRDSDEYGRRASPSTSRPESASCDEHASRVSKALSRDRLGAQGSDSGRAALLLFPTFL